MMSWRVAWAWSERVIANHDGRRYATAAEAVERACNWAAEPFYLRQTPLIQAVLKARLRAGDRIEGETSEGSRYFVWIEEVP